GRRQQRICDEGWSPRVRNERPACLLVEESYLIHSLFPYRISSCISSCRPRHSTYEDCWPAVPRGIVTDTSDQGPYGKCLMRRRMTLRRWSASDRLMIDDVPKRSAAHRSTPKDGSVSHEFHSHRGLERRGDRGQKRSRSDSTL